MINKSNVLLRQ